MLKSIKDISKEEMSRIKRVFVMPSDTGFKASIYHQYMNQWVSVEEKKGLMVGVIIADNIVYTATELRAMEQIATTKNI